ncbi:MAG TPA: adenylate/guanylate cyclase domain-containing protein [Pararhizobium sp.]|uniref:adenylate/guanylate cyclase domain-containing protein n=1 Tax=Pararhizobium sp. TaxID=1977563 RepID=UPI002C4E6EE1|nr:adenylate/guanylate cyclase domain-containing protein [Pararhizobium sp.]HTO33971.1 adenylate/guanylate cyclase domain-containing protein [Pararhizobium sp.]
MSEAGGKPAAKSAAAVWTRPLRSLLGLAMAALLIAVSGTLVGLDYWRARKAAIVDAETDMRAFSDRLVDRLGILSGSTTALVGFTASIANSILVPPPDRMSDKIKLLREIIAQSQNLDGIYAGYPDGAFIQVVTLKAKPWRIALNAPEKAVVAVRSMQIDAGGEQSNRLIFLDEDGNQLLERRLLATGYDPRRRPWYQVAVNGRKPAAIGPYTMVTTDAPGMTISQAHRGNGGIVIGADIDLATITDFLARERLTTGTIAFIMDAAGRPIIHSDRALMARMLAMKEKGERDSGSFSDPLVSGIRTTLPKDDGVSFATIDGRVYVVMTTSVKSALLLAGHRTVVAAPLDELTETANRNLYQGLAISATVVFLGLLSALFLARVITRSLGELTDNANRLQDLDFTAPRDLNSHVTEISSLGRAMNRARDAIFTFALYVPKELVRKGIESGQFAGRGARRQEVTAWFTDIYDFTTISEQHSPEEVVALLSDYFDIFNETVSAHGGEIIQFLGDSVFAMWNAPMSDEHHAENACRCALAVERKLTVFNADLKARGLPELRTRFGIHTGTAVVGSVGAKERLQYTAMGDTVNVASRLEGTNKVYGTTILASSAVVAQCADRILFRPLGQAQVKGRATALLLYEVVGERMDAEQCPQAQEGTEALGATRI